MGSVHWFEGLFIFLITALLSAVAVAQLVGIPLATHHSEEILLIGLIPLFVLTDGLTRLHTVMRTNLGASLPQTLRILGMWFSVKFSNPMAATKGFLGIGIPFVRTPKAPAERIGRKEALQRAVGTTRFESFVAGVLTLLAVALAVRLAFGVAVVGIVETPVIFLFLWILYYGIVFASAPIYAYKSYVTFRPEPKLKATPSLPPASQYLGS